MEIQLGNEKMLPYRVYLFRKVCTTFGSSSKEGLYNRRFLNRTRFKAHTVVEDEAWILIRTVLVADVCFSNATMSDINAVLSSKSFQQLIKFKCSYEL